MEWIGAPQSCCIDCCAQIGFSIGSPFGAIAVSDLALDDAWPERPLADVVGGIDFAGKVAECEQLIARAPDLPEQFARQFALGGRGENGIEVAYQLPSSAFHCRGGERGDVTGKSKGAIEPEFDAHADKVAAVLFYEARLPVEMSKTGLVLTPMPLLAGIAIRYPDVWLVPRHGVAHNLRGAAEPSGMNDSIGRAENPLIAVAAFDPHAGFVASYNLRAAQSHEGIIAPGSKDGCGAFEHVHQRALADAQPKQIAEYALQPLVGKQLVSLEIERERMDATAERRALRRLRHGRAGCLAALRAAAG